MEEIAKLEDEKKSLQADLIGEAGPIKWAILRQISILNRQIISKREELNACLQANGVRQPISTIFNCTATLTTTNPSAPGPFTSTLALGVWFDVARTQLRVISFSPIIIGPFSTPIGNNTTVVSMVGGGVGVFDKNTGAIGIPLTLSFDHSIDLLFYDEDSTLPLMFGTGSAGSLVGSPFNSTTRSATLVGTGVFVGGFLGGSRADLVASGAFVDSP
jgi:hypothetical protein